MKAILFLILAIFTGCLFGQYSETPAFPTHIAGGAGDQVLPKTAITPDGFVYICRFDNSATGNYDVYLQRLSQQGVQQWAANGILISNHSSMTWLTDYDMCVDYDGNAIVSFQDIRSGGVNNTVIYKVSPQGEMLWTANGITLSNDTSTDNANVSPKVLCTADNSCYVSWQRSVGATSEVIVQRLSPTGQKLWGEAGITLSSTAGKLNWPQLLASSDGDILLKYFLDSGPYWAPTRHVFISRYNPTGVEQWNSTISDAGGISAWNQIFGFEPDGSGGAVLAWYDDRNSDMVNEAYVAHVNGDGSLTMPQNGALVTGNTGNQQYYPIITVDPDQHRIYVFYKVTSSDQNQIGIGRQLMDYSGARLWGESGEMILPLSSYVAQPLYTYQNYSGIVVVYAEGTVPNSDMSAHLKASCFRNSGLSPFSAVPIATNGTNKLHFSFASHVDGWSSLVWEEGSSANDLYGMRLNRDGSLGMDYPAPLELSANLLPPNSIMLLWQAPSISYPPVNYEIYMNGSLSTVIAGDLTFYAFMDLDPGNYSFYIIAVYPDNHFSAPSNTAQIIIVANSDENIPSLGLQLSIYPNPLSRSAELRYYSKSAGLLSLQLFNLKGQKVQDITLPRAQTGWTSINWQAPEKLPKGVYFLRLKSAGEVLSRKLVIQ